MADITAIRLALATVLESVWGDVQGGQVSAYMRPDPIPPLIQIVPGEIDWHQALQDGCEMYTMNIQALVSETTDLGQQQLLDSLLASTGEQSIKQAVEADPTLDGLVDDLIVVKTKGYHSYRIGSGEFLGAEWQVHIYASGA